MAAEPAPIGEAQSAVQLVRQMRALLSCEGWAGMSAYLLGQREKLARSILDDDSLSKKDRDKMRAQYKVFRDLAAWPAETLQAQLSVLESSRQGNEDAEVL
jgi:hypothetical protein